MEFCTQEIYTLFYGGVMMKNYTVVMLDANHIADFKSNAKQVLSKISDLLHSFAPGSVQRGEIKLQNRTEALQVHKAEVFDTPSLLLVKNGFLTNLLDTTTVKVRDDFAAKLSEIQTASTLLKRAEENLLLSTALFVYENLPMEANGSRRLDGDEVRTKLRKMISEHPTVCKSTRSTEYETRIYEYIITHGETLSEGIFTGTI